MPKKVIVTEIKQFEARLLTRDDVEDPKAYDYNKPGEKWVLVQYEDGKCLWTPNYCLDTPKIKDHSKVKIVEK